MKFPDILYEDETCLALNKPAGLAVQGGKGVGISVDLLLKRRYTEAQAQPRLVHRLDKDTSGVLLTAKGAKNAAWYAGKIASREACKNYIAVCAASGRGNASNFDASGIINIPVEVHGNQKCARTRYILLGTGIANAPPPLPYAVFELELETGRLHQIRRHLQKINRPILGDDKYGDFALNKSLRKTFNLRRLLLHARSLNIPRPDGGALEISAPLPPEFTFWIEGMS
jgi:23S rRNA pseudouridine955/2504/2580 synthase